MGRPSSEAKPLIRVIEDCRVLTYQDSGHETLWQIPLDNVVLLAEYTTDEGPFLDDYFLIFVTKENETSRFVTASFYSDGLDDVFARMTQFWNSEIQLALHGSTDWASRVVWPAELVGQEYFESKVVQPDTLVKKLRRVVFGPSREYVPRDAVRKYLASL